MTFDSSKHPRAPAGSPQGGQFVAGDAVFVSPPLQSVHSHLAGAARVVSVSGDKAVVSYQTSSIHEDRATVSRSWLKKPPKGFEFTVSRMANVHNRGGTVSVEAAVARAKYNPGFK